MRLISILHDLCIALLVGGLAAVFVAAFLLFEVAPNREIAGQVGNALFNLLGPGTLGVVVFLLATRLILNRAETGRAPRAMTWLAVAAILPAAIDALWLTPAMDVIWKTAAHAADGSGLEGEARARFMALHGAGSACYLAMWLIGLALLGVRAAVRAPAASRA